MPSADAIAHIDQIPSLFYLVFVQHQMEIDEGGGLDKDKIRTKVGINSCPEGKEMIKEKYEAAKRIVQISAATGWRVTVQTNTCIYFASKSSNWENNVQPSCCSTTRSSTTRRSDVED